jgi:hypothetical protein
MAMAAGDIEAGLLGLQEASRELARSRSSGATDKMIHTVLREELRIRRATAASMFANWN